MKPVFPLPPHTGAPSYLLTFCPSKVIEMFYPTHQPFSNNSHLHPRLVSISPKFKNRQKGLCSFGSVFIILQTLVQSKCTQRKTSKGCKNVTLTDLYIEKDPGGMDRGHKRTQNTDPSRSHTGHIRCTFLHKAEQRIQSPEVSG